MSRQASTGGAEAWAPPAGSVAGRLDAQPSARRTTASVDEAAAHGRAPGPAGRGGLDVEHQEAVDREQVPGRVEHLRPR